MARALSLFFKGLALLIMIIAPLLGVWVASSLAAYANARVGWIALSGLLLFPVLPLSWEGVAEWRRRRRKVQRPRILLLSDRLVMRTLAVNVAFLGILLASTPKKAFIALSARGDWFLRDHHGAVAERVRRGVFKLAGGLEWLYDATHPNPYDKYEVKDQPRPDKPGKPIASPTATATGTSATAPTSTSPPSTPASWPMPRGLHPIVTSMPPEAEQSIESVGHYIAAHEKDPALRVKALHDWVADRIAYDGPAFRAGNIPFDDADAPKVFQRKLGVCAGYAQLMVALGKASGDEIVYVVGNVRTMETPVDGMAHAWNAVRIDGGWYLIDATFDAGYLDGDKFHKQYTSDYLFTPPDVFGVSHFPEDKDWQLRERPISRGDFIRQPMMQPAFFARHLRLVSPDRSQVTVNGPLDVLLDNPSTQLSIDYGPSAGGTRTSCKVESITHGRCDLPAGSWNVMLFGADKVYGQYEHLGTLQVNSR